MKVFRRMADILSGRYIAQRLTVGFEPLGVKFRVEKLALTPMPCRDRI
jgi:hypothetical protein